MAEAVNSNDPIEMKVGEKYAVGLEYKAPDLNEGETISGVTSAVTPAGLTKIGSPTIDGATVEQVVDAASAVAGVNHEVKFTVTTSAGHIYIDTVAVKIV